MLVHNLLIFGAGVVTVSARSIGTYMPHLHISSPFTPPASSHVEVTPSTDSSLSQCLFTPHQPLQKTQNPASIPPHAWPHIHSLLASHSNLLNPPPKSSVQTLQLAEQTGDSSLESVMLGVVYTVPEPQVEQKELRSLKERGSGGSRRTASEGLSAQEKCLESAMQEVESRRQMEGVLELEGKGKVGFLVYRVD